MGWSRNGQLLHTWNGRETLIEYGCEYGWTKRGNGGMGDGVVKNIVHTSKEDGPWFMGRDT